MTDEDLYNRFGGQSAFESRLWQNQTGLSQDKAPIFRYSDWQGPGISGGTYQGWRPSNPQGFNEDNFIYGYGRPTVSADMMSPEWGERLQANLSQWTPEQLANSLTAGWAAGGPNESQAAYTNTTLAENQTDPEYWTYGVKTGGQHGRTWRYQRQGDYIVPVQDLGISGGAGSQWDTNSEHRDFNQFAVNTALMATGAGALGTTGQTAANTYNVGNAANSAYQAAEDGDWGRALASGAGAVAGGAGMAGLDDLAKYANLTSRGAGLYNALQDGNPFAAAQAGLNTYDAYNKIPSGSMSDMFSGENMSEDYGWPVDDTGEGDWWSDGLNQEEGYDWSSEDPYASDPYAGYTPIDDGGYGPGETPGFSTGGGGGYGLSDFFRNPLVSQIGRGLFGGGGNRTAPTGPNRGSGGANRGSPGGGGGGGGGGLGGLLSSWYGSQAQGRYADDLKGIASEMKGNAEPYMQKLLESYTNPQSFMDSPEMQARLGIEANRLTGIDASKGRISNDIGRTKLLQDYGMAGLSDYRRGLTGSLSSIYQPQAISNLYKEASQADRGRYGDYAALLGGGGGMSWDDLQETISAGGDWWDKISSWWDKL